MLKQAFLINRDLKMDSGKIAVQVAHGEVMYMERIMDETGYINLESSWKTILKYREWRANTKEDPIGMMKKVVLKSSESEIRDMFMKLRNNNIWCYVIFDKGLTQVPENSLTCLVVEPLEEEQYNEFFENMKLL